MLLSSPLVVMFSVPPASLRGGSAVAAAVLRSRLEKHLTVVPFAFGRKTDAETTVAKIFGRLADLARSYRLMRRTPPDVIHLNSSFDPRSILRDALFVALARRRGIPVLILFHGSDDRCFGKLWGPIEHAKQLLLRRAARIGVLSEAERVTFRQTFRVVTDRVTVVKNVVDERFFEATSEPSTEPRILFISRFLKAKGPFDLLRAVPQVLARVPTARFQFAGDGEDLPAFRREVQRLGLSEAVMILNNIPNAETAELYRRAWMLVFPSHFPEGMPMVVAEALGCGLPVISTRTRFAESYLRDGEHVLYVPQGDPAALADRILQLIGDGALRRAMALANRRIARELFSGATVTGEFLALYTDMASRSGSTSETTVPGRNWTAP